MPTENAAEAHFLYKLFVRLTWKPKGKHLPFSIITFNSLLVVRRFSKLSPSLICQCVTVLTSSWPRKTAGSWQHRITSTSSSLQFPRPPHFPTLALLNTKAKRHGSNSPTGGDKRERKSICDAVTVIWWMVAQVTTVYSHCSHWGGRRNLWVRRL